MPHHRTLDFFYWLSRLLNWADRLSRKSWLRKLYIAITGVALALLLWTAVSNWQRLSQYQWQWQWSALVYSCLGYSGALGTAILGWRSIMRKLGCDLPLRKHWKVYTFTNIAKRLPSAIWYASGRVLMYEQMGTTKRVVSVSLILELVLIIYTGAMSVTVLSLLLGQSWNWSRQLWICAILMLCLVPMLKPLWTLRAFNQLQARLGRARIEVQLTWHDTARWVPSYTLTWIGGGIMLYWMIRAVYPLPHQAVIEVINMWTLSGLVGTLLTTFLPLSIGPRELTLAFLLHGTVPLPVAIAVALLSRVWLGINQLLWFGISWLL
jgi:uncharacterized membrane protein YbhN (UPF0104 family)